MQATLLNALSNLMRPWRWYIRAAILWVTLSSLAPVSHRVLPEGPHVVATQKPHVCVHTELINEVDEWKIQRSLQLVREMGADTIVEFFPWAYIEAREDHYNWAQADRIIHHAENQGIQVIARLGLVPGWARPRDTTLNYMPDQSLDDFAEFVAAFAARYAGRVDRLVIWNEPNLAFEWGFQEVDPDRYVRMLQTVYQPAHVANPDVMILAAGLAPTNEPPGSPHGLDDLIYLDRLYEADADEFFDALSFHTFGFTAPAMSSPASDRLNFRRAELLREIMLRHDDGKTPVYITESGWNDDPRWTNGVRPSQRVIYTLEAFQWAEENWPWAEQLCLWILRYPRPTGTYRDNFTLITPEFQLKPIYHALQAYARGWERTEVQWLPPPGE